MTTNQIQREARRLLVRAIHQRGPWHDAVVLAVQRRIDLWRGKATGERAEALRFLEETLRGQGPFKDAVVRAMQEDVSNQINDKD